MGSYHPPVGRSDNQPVSSSRTRAKLTLKPARCKRKAIRSRNETNCELDRYFPNRASRITKTHNTSDLIVASLPRSFSSSSSKASSFEDDLQFCSSVLPCSTDCHNSRQGSVSTEYLVSLCLSPVLHTYQGRLPPPQGQSKSRCGRLGIQAVSLVQHRQH